MRIVPLDSSWESAFWNYVLRDVPEYYFFILDWKLNKEKTKIFLAISNERVEGLMLVYDQRIIQVRGSLEAAELLMNEVNLEKAEINAYKEHEAIILKKYRPVAKHDMILMTLKRGEERLYIRHPITKLTPLDASEIAHILSEGFPEFGGFTSDRITERMKEDVLFLGVKEEERLVSFGNARVLEFGTNIGMVATSKEHRGKGYATSVVSALLKEILRESELAFIHVLSDNPSAVRVYTKVGFRPYKTYLFIQGQRAAE